MTHTHVHVYDSEVGFVKTSAKDGTPVYSLKCACGKVWGHFHGNRIPVSDRRLGWYTTSWSRDSWKASQHIERMNYTPDPQRRSLPPAPPPQCGFEEDK